MQFNFPLADEKEAELLLIVAQVFSLTCQQIRSDLTEEDKIANARQILSCLYDAKNLGKKASEGLIALLYSLKDQLLVEQGLQNLDN